MVSREEYHAAVAARMLEEELDHAVRELFNVLGLAPFTFHPPDGVGRFRAGFPDWLILGKWPMWRELKTEKGKLSAAQEMVIARLEFEGADVKVWRPRHLLDGTIERELRAVAVFPIRPEWMPKPKKGRRVPARKPARRAA